MTASSRFDEEISIKLKRDEAIVLFWYLTRELWNAAESSLRASFVHDAPTGAGVKFAHRRAER